MGARARLAGPVDRSPRISLRGDQSYRRTKPRLILKAALCLKY
jgi:hypothetical protein